MKSYTVGGIDYLYVGTLNPLGFNVFRSSDGVTFTPVVLFGNGAIGNSACMDLVVYDNKIYVGTMNFFVGTSLFVSANGITFTPVYTNGNGDRRNAYTWWMNEYNGRLYAGTFNTGDLLNTNVPGAFDLYSKVDPSDLTEDWVFETTNAFNNPGQYGIRSMEVFKDKLIIGTATASVPGSLKVYEASASDDQSPDAVKPRLVDTPARDYKPVDQGIDMIKEAIRKIVVDAGIDESELYK